MRKFGRRAGGWLLVCGLVWSSPSLADQYVCAGLLNFIILPQRLDYELQSGLEHAVLQGRLLEAIRWKENGAVPTEMTLRILMGQLNAIREDVLHYHPIWRDPLLVPVKLWHKYVFKEILETLQTLFPPSQVSTKYQFVHDPKEPYARSSVDSAVWGRLEYSALQLLLSHGTGISALPLVKVLVEDYGVDVNWTAADGETALSLALKKEDWPVLGYLLKIPDIQIRTKTPWELQTLMDKHQCPEKYRFALFEAHHRWQLLQGASLRAQWIERVPAEPYPRRYPFEIGGSGRIYSDSARP